FGGAWESWMRPLRLGLGRSSAIWLGREPESSLAITTVTMAMATSAVAAPERSRRWGERRSRSARALTGGPFERERRGKPAATRSSSRLAKSSRGVGRASASAVARSPWSLERSIACLPQFVHRPVEPGADVRGADARYAGDLAIGEAGEELERDQLAL